MEIKNLLTKLRHKEETPEHFFAIEISSDTIKSAVWTVLNGNTNVVSFGSTHSWDGKNSESLLELIDQSISKASSAAHTEPDSVIFGLPESWLEGDSISSEKKQLLKLITQELTLKPLGFVVTDTAIIKYLKIEEGTPPSAIFLQLNPSELNLTLVKLGKIVGQELVGRSNDLGADVEEGLSRFKNIDTLPSRMIIYNGKSDFEEDIQQLTSYDWEERLPFIHFPKVESLPSDASIKAIALAGGSEVAKSLGFEISPEPDVQTAEEMAPDHSKSTAKPISSKNLPNFGFSKQDILASTSSPKKTTTSPSSSDDPLLPTDSVLPKPATQSLSFSQKLNSTLNSIKSSFFKFVSKIHFLKKSQSTKSPLIILIIIVATVATILGSMYWYLPKANITLVVKPKIIQEDLTITVDPKISSLDLEAGILPGEALNISVSGSQSISTTGTALVGEPASGSITIFNKTNDSVTFDQGTVLVSDGNLSFTLDQDTTVASSSSTIDADDNTIISPGKATANVTAKSIGPEGNLLNNAKLSFKQFSEDDYYARVNNDLSGGSAREAKAVALADQQTLLSQLTEELRKQAQAELQEKIGEDRTLISTNLEEALTSKSFNHDVDEESDSLRLDAKLEYTAFSFFKSDLELILSQAIKEKIPDNFSLSQESVIDTKSSQVNSDGTAQVKASFKAQLIPKIDFSELKTTLKGKKPQLISSYLNSIPNFVRADITFTPKLPESIKTLPRVKKNITLEISLED